MSVRCPKCGTQHRLSATIPPEGLLARCTSCAAVFRIEAPQASGYGAPQQQRSDEPLSQSPSPPAESPREPEAAAPAPTPSSEEVVKDEEEREATEPVTVSGPGDPPSTTERGSLPVASKPDTVVEQHTVDPDSAKDVLALVLRGEQERREMMYHVTREISRLREAVEQQHELLAEVTEQVSDYTKRVASALTPPPLSSSEVTSQELSQDDFGRLQELNAALSREREVVERLRKSKLDLERRTADAEAQLEDLRNRSLIDRLLGRHDD